MSDAELRGKERAWRLAGGGTGWGAPISPDEIFLSRAYVAALDRAGFCLLPAKVYWPPNHPPWDRAHLPGWVRNALGLIRSTPYGPSLTEVFAPAIQGVLQEALANHPGLAEPPQVEVHQDPGDTAQGLLRATVRFRPAQPVEVESVTVPCPDGMDPEEFRAALEAALAESRAQAEAQESYDQE
jgi:hypothetical protein